MGSSGHTSTRICFHWCIGLKTYRLHSRLNTLRQWIGQDICKTRREKFSLGIWCSFYWSFNGTPKSMVHHLQNSGIPVSHDHVCTFAVDFTNSDRAHWADKVNVLPMQTKFVHSLVQLCGGPFANVLSVILGIADGKLHTWPSYFPPTVQLGEPYFIDFVKEP